MSKENINWIDCGLPVFVSYDPELAFPDTLKKEKEKFGMTFNEYIEKYHPLYNKKMDKEKWQKIYKEYYSWIESLPEIIDYHNKHKIKEKELKNKSFCGKGLNKVGTLVELEDGSIHLIGSLDTNLGDDCRRLLPVDTIVKRYAVVFDMENV
jgi:hypothetical protein